MISAHLSSSSYGVDYRIEIELHRNVCAIYVLTGRCVDAESEVDF